MDEIACQKILSTNGIEPGNTVVLDSIEPDIYGEVKFLGITQAGLLIRTFRQENKVVPFRAIREITVFS